MLCAAAQSCEQKPDDDAVERAGEAREPIADSNQCRADRQDLHAAEAHGKLARGDLPHRHRTGIDGLERADGRVAQAELRLQQRIEDVQKIGETVVQRMGPAAHGERPAG